MTRLPRGQHDAQRGIRLETAGQQRRVLEQHVTRWARNRWPAAWLAPDVLRVKHPVEIGMQHEAAPSPRPHVWLPNGHALPHDRM